jgi:ribosome-associated protein
MSTSKEWNAGMFQNELSFSTSRSSGPGGQSVNKVNSKVTLHFNVSASQVLSENEKEIIHKKLSNYINQEGELLISSQENRSQLDNKEAVQRKFEQLLIRAFTIRKPRKKTKPTKASKQKRIDQKKKAGEKKKLRKKLL